MIADISGFTDFMKIHNMEKRPLVGSKIAAYWKSHADKLISELLETVVDAVEPLMVLNKLEGDAALFYVEDDDTADQPKIIYTQLSTVQEAFREKLRALQFVRACPCDPCQQSRNLKLKIILHKGEFQISQFRQFEELSGVYVILVHRLLKNSIKSGEYWLFTQDYADLVYEVADNLQPTRETIDDFGTLKLALRNFERAEKDIYKRSSLSKLLNMPRMLSFYR